jgi:hypothetical protein
MSLNILAGSFHDEHGNDWTLISGNGKHYAICDIIGADTPLRTADYDSIPLLLRAIADTIETGYTLPR